MRGEPCVQIADVLKRWEAVLPRPFPATVWQEYAEAMNRPVCLAECSVCGFGRFEPVVTGSAGFYEAVSAHDYYNAGKWEFISAVDDLRETSARRILDVGCGSGYFLGYLREHLSGADLYGYEINEGLLKQLADQGFGVLPRDPEQFGYALAGQPPFDAVCVLQVLEHTEDPVAFLRTFLNLLRPGGLLIVTTPDAAGPIRSFPDALTEIPPHHVTRWTREAFAALLPRVGAQVRTVRTEPLPDYLWDSYLPVMWDDPIWPAQVFDPIAQSLGLHSVGERAAFAAQAMRGARIRWLNGVRGHTIYITALRSRR